MDKDTGIVQFNGSNFADWKFRMEFLFREKQLFVHIDHEATAMERLGHNFDRNEIVAQNLIVKHVAASHCGYLRDRQSAFEMWRALQSVFERATTMSKIMIRKALNDMNFDGKGQLQAFFNEFDTKAREYIVAGGRLDDDEIAMMLLTAMPSSYDIIVTTVSSQAEMTSNQVKSQLLEYELKLKGKATKETSETAAFQARAQDPKKKVRCYACGKLGHKANVCRSKKKHNEQGHQNSNGSNGYAVLGKTSDEQEMQTKADEIEFIIDSGATEHLVTESKFLSNLRTLDVPIEILVAKDSETIQVTSAGDIQVKSLVDGREIDLTINEACVAEGLRHNLFSVRRVEMKGGEVSFKQGKAFVKMNGTLIAVGQRVGSLYLIKFKVKRTGASMMSAKEDATQLWHRRLGHLSVPSMAHLINDCLVEGVKDDVRNTLAKCEPCMMGKMTRQPFSNTRPKTSRPLERIHSDVCGPMNEDLEGNRYYVSFLDDYTHLTMTFLMKKKSEVFEKFKTFHARVQSHFKERLEYFRCDGGGEYKSKEFQSYMREHGITIEYTAAYNPELNGVSERLNRTLMDKVRSMMTDSSLPSNMWGEAVMAATYLLNRSPTVALKNKTPFEMYYGRKPNIANLKVWGCKAYIHVPKERRTKLEPHCTIGIMVGYDINGYRILNPRTETIIIARNVTFDETPEIALTIPNTTEKTLPVERSTAGDLIDFLAPPPPVLPLPLALHRAPLQPITPAQTTNKVAEESSDSPASIESPIRGSRPEPAPRRRVSRSMPRTTISADSPMDLDEDETVSEPESSAQPIQNQRPSRNRRPPLHFNDFEVYAAFSAFAEPEDVPRSYHEVATNSNAAEWRSAIKDEMESLIHNQTWKVVPKPEGAKLLGTRWVFRKKDSPDGVKFKARLVAQGFLQKAGVDFQETYAPVARLPTLRVLLSVSVHRQLHLRQLDVKTAFLHGHLEETIYIRCPDGFHVPEGKVMKLCKSLYGLKQGPKCWNRRFDTFATSLGFKKSAADSCLYILESNEITVYLLLYVDDMILASSSQAELNKLVAAFSSEFDMKDLGQLSKFMGMRINYDVYRGLLSLDQEEYIEQILAKLNMSQCKAVSTPIESLPHIEKADPANFTEHPYRTAIGMLMYLVLCTRPDLAFAVNYFSRFQDAANDQHWNYVKRVLRYLRGSSDVKLVYRRSEDAPILVGYTDADHAADRLDCKSTSGYVFKLFNNSVLWASRKQQTVALSTTEAEYVSACMASKEALWLHKLITDMKIEVPLPLEIFEDNQGAIFISKNPETRLSKHIAVKLFFLRDLVEEGKLKLTYIRSEEQLADVLTKALPAPKFNILRQQLGLEREGV